MTQRAPDSASRTVRVEKGSSGLFVPTLDAEGIVAAAKAVILREGYGASVETIIREAGIARQSLYNYFENKKALYRAVIESLIADYMKPLISLELTEDTEVPDAFMLLGTRYMEMSLHPDSLAMTRLISTAVNDLPEVGAMVYAVGPQRWIPTLATFLRAQAKAGRITCDDPEVIAESFFAALVGAPRFRYLMNLEVANSPAERADYVAKITRLYVDGLHYRP